MSSYSTDTDHTSCLDTYEYLNSHLDAVRDQMLMSDGPVLKQKIRDVSNDPLTRKRLISAQKEDQELALLCSKSFSEEEAEKDPVRYFMKDEVLMRIWRPPDVTVEDEWTLVYQIVIPQVTEVMSLAHDTPKAEHLGINKIYNKILPHFYWPNIR